jgi:nitronate monooxygenase
MENVHVVPVELARHPAECRLTLKSCGVPSLTAMPTDCVNGETVDGCSAPSRCRAGTCSVSFTPTPVRATDAKLLLLLLLLLSALAATGMSRLPLHPEHDAIAMQTASQRLTMQKAFPRRSAGYRTGGGQIGCRGVGLIPSQLGLRMLRTALTDILGIRIPILNAPMTPQAGGALAAAVCDAGGFGMLGFDEDEGEESIAAQAAMLDRRAFGIGMAAWVLDARPHLLDLAIRARPKLVSISFGDAKPYVEKLHAAGIVVASQVQSRRWAQTALEAGVDVLVAQGSEAGGHTGGVGTMVLMQTVLAMTEKPVLVAGGIASGRGVAAVLAAGAAGAWIGTPFLLAAESRTPEEARRRIAASDETQTIKTHVYDRLQHKPWPDEFAGRALRNAFVERWHGREDELMQTPDAVEEFAKAKAARDYSRAHVYAGESVGLVDRVERAAEIVGRLEREAVERLRAAAPS